MGDVADVVKMADSEIITLGEGDEGRRLPVYSICDETGRYSIGDQEDQPRTHTIGDITSRTYGETIFGLLDDGRKMINTIADEGST